MKLGFLFDSVLDFDPGYGRFEPLPGFDVGLFCYLFGTAFGDSPEEDQFGVAPNAAFTGATLSGAGLGALGFQAATGEAFIDLPFNGRSLLAAGGGSVTVTLVAKTSMSTLIMGDNTAQPSTEPRATMYRLPNANSDLVAGTINDGAAAGANSAGSVLNQSDNGQTASWAVYTLMFTPTSVQVAYRRSGYLNGIEQLAPAGVKADADPVGNPAGQYRLGRSFPGSNLPANTNSYVVAIAHGKLLTAGERDTLFGQIKALLEDKGAAV